MSCWLEIKLFSWDFLNFENEYRMSDHLFFTFILFYFLHLAEIVCVLDRRNEPSTLRRICNLCLNTGWSEIADFSFKTFLFLFSSKFLAKNHTNYICRAGGRMPTMRSSVSAYNTDWIFCQYFLSWKCWCNLTCSSSRSCCSSTSTEPWLLSKHCSLLTSVDNLAIVIKFHLIQDRSSIALAFNVSKSSVLTQICNFRSLITGQGVKWWQLWLIALHTVSCEFRFIKYALS